MMEDTGLEEDNSTEQVQELAQESAQDKPQIGRAHV